MMSGVGVLYQVYDPSKPLISIKLATNSLQPSSAVTATRGAEWAEMEM